MTDFEPFFIQCLVAGGVSLIVSIAICIIYYFRRY